MNRVSAILIMLAFTAGMRGQDATITAKLDTSSILIGDQIHFRVSAALPSGSVIILPLAKDTLTDKVLILSTSKRDSSTLSDGRKLITDDYLITCFDSGSYVIAPFAAQVISNGIHTTIYSNASGLYVTRPVITPADTTDVIYDIVGPRKAPLTFMETVPWIIILAVMALIVWLLVLFLPRNPFRKLVKKEKPSEPAHKIALRELEQLRQEELWQKGEVKEYYSKLSDILRRYIDGRFDIQSPELTTDETVRKLQRSGLLKNEVLLIVKLILSDSDMVKFAKFLPDEEVNRESIEKAIHFVEITRPYEIIPENTAETEKKGGSNE
jgi:hypothetical protein